MVEFDFFRQNLATALLCCADRRRSSFSEGHASGEDLKVVALLEHLAADAENLDLHVFLIFELMFTHKHLAQHFLQHRDDLLAQVGVSYCPSNATDLVRWMTRQTSSVEVMDAESQRSADPASRGRPVSVLRNRTISTLTQAIAPSGRKPSWMSDFSIGFGIVAPMLAIWQVGLGIGQLRDHAAIDGHAAVPASVISVDEVAGGGKSATSTTNVVLAFEPSGSSSLCRVTLRSNSSVLPVEAGQFLQVVPRSPDCEMPLIPSQIGDPLHTFASATVLMIAGVACLIFRRLLGESRPRPLTRPVWS